MRLARELGFETVVIDGRPAFATPERFPDVDRLVVGWPDEVADEIGLGPNDAVAVLTHDVKFDEPAIVEALRRGCRYVGAVGSKKTQADRRQRLLEAGVTPDELARLRGPVGLDLGGRQPAETALAILAEVVAERYGGSGAPARRERRCRRGRRVSGRTWTASQPTTSTGSSTLDTGTACCRGRARRRTESTVSAPRGGRGPGPDGHPPGSRSTGDTRSRPPTAQAAPSDRGLGPAPSDLPPVPIAAVAGRSAWPPARLGVFEVEIPVPALGPATLDAEVAGVRWELEAKLDIASDMDSAIDIPIVLLQPDRAPGAPAWSGPAEFDLFEAADSAVGEATGSIELDPVPLVCGDPFSGRLRLQLREPLDVQEVRVELRVRVEATVSGGLDETITAWVGRASGPGRLAGRGRARGRRHPARSTVADHRAAPWLRRAEFHVILARSWARDPHLVRGVAIADDTRHLIERGGRP